MILHQYNPDYHNGFIQKWWESRQDIDFPVGLLPDIGKVMYDEEHPVAAAFLYTTNSKIAWVGWPISDPESDKDIRDEALDRIFRNLHDLAKQKKHTMIWSTSGIPSLQERLERLGYIVGDKGINQYFKELV